MDKVELQYEKRDSIEVTRNAKGEYGWKAKVYYDRSNEDAASVVEHLEAVDVLLKERFLSG